MARILGVLARQLVGKRSNPGVGLVRHLQLPFISSETQTLKTLTSIPTIPHSIPSTSKPLFNSLHSPNHRRLCASSSGDLPNVVLIRNWMQFVAACYKVKKESLSAIYFFMAVTDYFSKVISTLIEELSKEFPHIITYEVDVQENFEDVFPIFQIHTVPTLSFFESGKFVCHLPGHDVSSVGLFDYELSMLPNDSNDYHVDKESSAVETTQHTKCRSCGNPILDTQATKGEEGKGIVAGGRRVGGAVKSSQQNDPLVEAVESSTATSIPELMQALESLPGASPEIHLWLCATQLIIKSKAGRDMFSTLA